MAGGHRHVRGRLELSVTEVLSEEPITGTGGSRCLLNQLEDEEMLPLPSVQFDPAVSGQDTERAGNGHSSV